MVNPRIIIVTGANRGIGRAICETILSRPNVGPIKLFAASRAGQDLGLGGQNETQQILYPKLDVTDKNSISALRKQIEQHGPVSTLINNAGVNLDQQYNYENSKRTIDVNYQGTVDMCETFLPILNDQGSRIVNLSSIASTLKIYIAAKDRILGATTKEELDQIAADYLQSVQNSTETRSGFGVPKRAYMISKALVRAYTSILSHSVNGTTSSSSSWSSSAAPKTLINSCCPGWVDTDMGRPISSRATPPPKTPAEGAIIPVRLALDDIRGVTGKYWANASVRYKDEGEVQEWK